jgi:hypothetical protein
MKYLFISAELSNLSMKENKQRTESLRRTLNGLKLLGFVVTPVVGVYKGVNEASFRVTAPDYDNFNIGMIRTVARNLGQESLLWVRDDGNSFLDFIQSGDMLHLGKMKRVESTEGLEAYSIIRGKPYAVVK